MGKQSEIVLPAGVGPVSADAGSIFFVGTATVILRVAGFTILTDPNFLHAGDHVHLGYGITSRRLTEPAMEIEDLPPLDLVVLSHLHEDHFDRVAAAKLDRRVPILTTPHAAASLRKKGFREARALSTWDAIDVRKGDARLRLTAMPGRHGPPLVARLLPPVMGSMLEFSSPAHARPVFRLYVSGDTLVHGDLREIPRRYPGIDMALLHLGGTRILGVLVTMDAAQGIEAIRIVDPRLAIPIHYDDYTVFESPLEDFQRAVRAAGLEDRVRYLRRGETYGFDVAHLHSRPAAPLPARPLRAAPETRGMHMLKELIKTVGAGLAGSIALNILHEASRKTLVRAPRMDLVGERALSRGLRAIGVRPPRGRSLYRSALAADLAANALYYAFTRGSRHPWRRGLLLGLAAGLGAVYLTPLLGLGRAPRGLTPRTKAMTVGWYVAGGLASAAASRALGEAAEA